MRLRTLALAGAVAATLAVGAPGASAGDAPAFDFSMGETVFTGSPGCFPYCVPGGNTAAIEVPAGLVGHECDVWAVNDGASVWTGNTVTVESLPPATGYEDTIPQATLLGTLALPASLSVTVGFSDESTWTNPWEPPHNEPGNAGPFASFDIGVDCPEPEEPTTTTSPPVEEPAPPAAAAPVPPASPAAPPPAPAVAAEATFTG